MMKRMSEARSREDVLLGEVGVVFDLEDGGKNLGVSEERSRRMVSEVNDSGEQRLARKRQRRSGGQAREESFELTS